MKTKTKTKAKVSVHLCYCLVAMKACIRLMRIGENVCMKVDLSDRVILMDSLHDQIA